MALDPGSSSEFVSILLLVSVRNPIEIDSGPVGSKFSNEVIRNQYLSVGIICFPVGWLHSQDRVTSHSGKMTSKALGFCPAKLATA